MLNVPGIKGHVLVSFDLCSLAAAHLILIIPLLLPLLLRSTCLLLSDDCIIFNSICAILCEFFVNLALELREGRYRGVSRHDQGLRPVHLFLFVAILGHEMDLRGTA